ncbi:hypothetical protein ACFV9E_09015 [Streptomyces sp. NPDC059835]|uniref:hypothetical protein n=1 Tax=Streptomyces sp. NPDC059835 TaxID=3346967 RepID=UPI003653ACAC
MMNTYADRLRQAKTALDAAQQEYDAALLDMLANGPHGSQKVAADITGLTREALRLRGIKAREAQSEVQPAPAAVELEERPEVPTVGGVQLGVPVKADEPLYTVTIPARVVQEFDEPTLAFNEALAELDVKPGGKGSLRVTATKADHWDLRQQAYVLGEPETKEDDPDTYRAFLKWIKAIESAKPVAVVQEQPEPTVAVLPTDAGIRAMARTGGMTDVRAVEVDGVVIGYTAEHGGTFSAITPDGETHRLMHLTRSTVTTWLKRRAAGVPESTSSHITYTAPDGTTRTSTHAYTHAVIAVGDDDRCRFPTAVSFHASAALAEKKAAGLPNFATLVAPVTADGTIDPEWATRVRALGQSEVKAERTRAHRSAVSSVLKAAGWRPRNQERMTATGYNCQGDRDGRVWVTYRPDSTHDEGTTDEERSAHIADVIAEFARLLHAAGYPTDHKPGAKSLYVTGGKVKPVKVKAPTLKEVREVLAGGYAPHTPKRSGFRMKRTDGGAVEVSFAAGQDTIGNAPATFETKRSNALEGYAAELTAAGFTVTRTEDRLTVTAAV